MNSRQQEDLFKRTSLLIVKRELHIVNFYYTGTCLYINL